MSACPEHPAELSQGLPAKLCGRWREICSRYLPVAPDDSIWRFSRAAAPGDPEQGWKLHVSATVLTACTVMERVAPALHERGAQFKAPSSLLEIYKLNCGLFYGYSQVGKFLTVYPRTDEEALDLAGRLYELTRHMSAPVVPFDRRFGSDGCVYYRYGAFRPLLLLNPDGTQTSAVRDPEGRFIPDLRDVPQAVPEWVTDPFAAGRQCFPTEPADSPLKTTYRVYRALTQRGKGGVYEAIDLSINPPRLCVLKEGRREGELSWDGRDGSWRIRHEEQVIRSLRKCGVNAPRVYSSFVAEGNYYLVTELIEGENLQDFLLRRRRRVSVTQGLRLGAGLASLLARIHSAGWTWRDCKPANVMVTKQGDLRPLDFEGACPVDEPDPAPWGTRGYTPNRWPPCAGSRVYEDLYALGATIYFLLTGALPEAPTPPPIRQLRRNVPSDVCRLISELLTADPNLQPSAQAVTCRLLIPDAPPQPAPGTYPEPR